MVFRFVLPRLLPAWGAFLCSFIGLTGLAQATTGLYQDTLFAARANPSGVVVHSSFELRHQLYSSTSKVLEQNFLAPALRIGISPANASLGAAFIVQPLSILSLWAELRGNQYFGTFRRLQSFGEITANFSDEVQSRRAEANRHYSTLGLQAFVGGVLQLKLGRFAWRSSFRGLWQDFELADGQPYFYESELDVLVRNRGWTIAGDSDFFYFAGERLIVGLRHALVTPLYTKASCEERACPKGNQRLGPLVGWRLISREKGSGPVEDVLLIGMVSWYLEHTYRAGQVTAQGVPYVALALKFSGWAWSGP